MGQRINMQEIHPEAYKALINLAGTVGRSNLTPIQTHLIKIRTSIMNSCAYCIDMHTKEALKIGETQQRIFLIPAWREASVFTDEERALLALTEEVTIIHQKGVSEKTYSEAEQFFSPDAIADIIMETISMNSLNRMVVSTRFGRHVKPRVVHH